MISKSYSRLFIILLLVMNLMAAQGWAAEVMEVSVNQSKVLSFSGVEKVAVANSDIADVMVLSSSEVLLVGKRLGTTTVHVWSYQGRASYAIKVTAGDELTANSIKEALGYPEVRVQKIGQTVLLEGVVQDQLQKTRAEKVAGMYGDKVLNLLEMRQPVQIKIEAILLEIDKQKAKELGIKWGNGIGTGFSEGSFSFGQSFVNPLGGGRPFGQLGGYAAINAQLSALIKNESARILSQPSMVTLSGDKANIMVGGQIPVPVSVQGNQIGIEWKDYGIKLDIIPEVDASGLINSKVKAEVSSLDWNSTHKIQLGPNMYIPPLKLRKAETSIALSSGQMMAIGGLIGSEVTEDIYRVPFLADIPILGNLFKSKSFSKSETELLILIVPSIVDINQNQQNAQTELHNFKNGHP